MGKLILSVIVLLIGFPEVLWAQSSRHDVCVDVADRRFPLDRAAFLEVCIEPSIASCHSEIESKRFAGAAREAFLVRCAAERLTSSTTAKLPCRALLEHECGAVAHCSWIPVAMAASGVLRKAYCRTRSTTARLAEPVSPPIAATVQRTQQTWQDCNYATETFNGERCVPGGMSPRRAETVPPQAIPAVRSPIAPASSDMGTPALPVAALLLAILVVLGALWGYRSAAGRQWLANWLVPAAAERHEPNFAAQPSVPPPIPQHTQPAPYSARDSAAALRALRLAKSFIDEVEDQVGTEPAHPSARASLALAAKQLDIAYRTDPDAVLLIDDTQMAFTQVKLRAHALDLQALVAESPDMAIRYAEQATTADPTYDPAFFTLGLLHSRERHKREAVAALKSALALGPDNIEYAKELMRAEAITTAEIVTYRATKIATDTAEVGAKIWSGAQLVFWLTVVVLSLAPFYFLASCVRDHEIAQGRSGDGINTFSFLFLFVVFAFAMKLWNNMRGRF